MVEQTPKESADEIDPVEIADWDAVPKRGLKQHLENSFWHTYKPVFDDEPIRMFDTMAEYQQWCNRELPRWLGYSNEGRENDRQGQP